MEGETWALGEVEADCRVAAVVLDGLSVDCFELFGECKLVVPYTCCRGILLFGTKRD